MSEAIEINGVTLVPIKEAAVSVHYSRDYVARLAREGKIVASQIGRQWFVDLASLQNFSTAASVHEEVRKRDLSTIRKSDLEVKERLLAVQKKSALRARSHRVDAALVAGCTLCLGLLTGLGTYTASSLPLSFSPRLADYLAQISRPVVVMDEVSPVATELPTITEVAETVLMTAAIEQPVFADEVSVRHLTGTTDGVLVFSSSAALPDASAVADLFSDDVTVNFTDEQSGVIEYEHATGEVTEYPFVAVPGAVTEVATSSSTAVIPSQQ
jgi:hypothetical protein